MKEIQKLCHINYIVNNLIISCYTEYYSISFTFHLYLFLLFIAPRHLYFAASELRSCSCFCFSFFMLALHCHLQPSTTNNKKICSPIENNL